MNTRTVGTSSCDAPLAVIVLLLIVTVGVVAPETEIPPPLEPFKLSLTIKLLKVTL